MKFYRYVIYKLYSLGKRRPNDTPIANVVLTLSFVHFVQLFTIYMILIKFIPAINVFNTIEKNIYLYIVGGVFILLNYLLLYSKKRWQNYVKEFSNESKIERLRGNFYVLGYLIGSILLFFLVVIIIYR